MLKELVKFLPNLAKILNWLTSLPVLSNYYPNYETVVATDLPFYWLGTVLMQMFDGKLKPICYAWRSLTATEQRYVEIKKKALGITWAREQFCSYMIGLSFSIQIDHKSLITLLGKKNFVELSPQIKRFACD